MGRRRKRHCSKDAGERQLVARHSAPLLWGHSDDAPTLGQRAKGQLRHGGRGPPAAFLGRETVQRLLRIVFGTTELPRDPASPLGVHPEPRANRRREEAM